MMKTKCIFDTNVLLSAAIRPQSVSAAAVKKANNTCEIFMSIDTFSELEDVLSRTKFDKYISDIARAEFLAHYYNECTLFYPEIEIQLCRDPKDDKFLSLAAACQADFLITGDQDLLVLNPFQQIQIITPSDFLDL